MPFHFEFNPEHRILLVVAEGEFGDADQLGILDEIRKQTIVLHVAAGIGDYSQIQSFTASASAVQAAAQMPSPYPASIPRFLAAPVDHVFGVSRMYKALADETRSTLKVVRSRAEVFKSLGVSNPIFERLDPL